MVDVPGAAEPDRTIRPNMIFALSLPFPLVEPTSETGRAVFKVVTDELLTPVGLRTLSPSDPQFKPHYGPGDQAVRDGSYHQGTVWPWLFGAYFDAQRKIDPSSKSAPKLLNDFLTRLNSYGVGSIAEIYDGSEPYRPNGCIAQAWSVAEVLRSLKGK